MPDIIPVGVFTCQLTSTYYLHLKKFGTSFSLWKAKYNFLCFFFLLSYCEHKVLLLLLLSRTIKINRIFGRQKARKVGHLFSYISNTF